MHRKHLEHARIPTTRYLYEPHSRCCSLQLFIAKTRINLPTLITFALFVVTAVLFYYTVSQVMMRSINSQHLLALHDEHAVHLGPLPISQFIAQSIRHTNNLPITLPKNPKIPHFAEKLVNYAASTPILSFSQWRAQKWSHMDLSTNKSISSKNIIPHVDFNIPNFSQDGQNLVYYANNPIRSDPTTLNHLLDTPRKANNPLLLCPSPIPLKSLTNDIFYAQIPKFSPISALQNPPYAKHPEYTKYELSQNFIDVICAFFFPNGGVFGLCKPLSNPIDSNNNIPQPNVIKDVTATDIQPQPVLQHTNHTESYTSIKNDTTHALPNIHDPTVFAQSSIKVYTKRISSFLSQSVNAQITFLVSLPLFLHHKLSTESPHYLSVYLHAVYCCDMFIIPFIYLTYLTLLGLLEHLVDNILLSQYNHIVVILVTFCLGAVFGSIISLKPIYDYVDVVVPAEEYNTLIINKQALKEKSSQVQNINHLPQNGKIIPIQNELLMRYAEESINSDDDTENYETNFLIAPEENSPDKAAVDAMLNLTQNSVISKNPIWADDIPNM